MFKEMRHDVHALIGSDVTGAMTNIMRVSTLVNKPGFSNDIEILNNKLIDLAEQIMELQKMKGGSNSVN